MNILFEPLRRVDYDISNEDLQNIIYSEFEVDLHGLNYNEALGAIRRIVKNAPSHVKSIYVIHGYIGGTELKKMVTKQNLKSSKIKHVNPTFNPGKSVIVFKENE